MPINLPSTDIAEDIRQPIVGDSFSWDGIEPGPAKKQIVIHGTASEAPNEDGFTMAEYHVNNGWGGIGVHFVVPKDSYPGRSYPGGSSPRGAHAQYVGDLLTSRAGVYDNNPGKIHIEISGLFTPGHEVPSEAQLRATRNVIEHLLFHTPELSSLQYFSQVTYHNAIAVPDHGTECPGWQHPQFGEWFGYLQGGPEPSWWAPKASPAPPPPPPAPPQVETPPQPVEKPEWERTWRPDTAIPRKRVKVPVTPVYAPVTNTNVKDLPGGEPLKDLAGYFTVNGVDYVRTQWSTDHGFWYGVSLNDLEDLPAETPAETPPTPPAPPVNPGAPVDSIQPPPVTDGSDFFDDLPYPNNHEPVPPQDQKSLWDLLKAVFEFILGILLAPLRLAGYLNNLRKGQK